MRNPLAGSLGAQATTVRLHNSCNYTVCAKYWVPNSPIGGACSQQGLGGVWSVGLNGGWSAATMWAIANTGWSGQVCNTGPPSSVTQFEFTIASSGGNDYYDVSSITRYNIAMRVIPTNGAYPTIICRDQDDNSYPSGYYPGGPDMTKAFASGSTDYDVYLCG
ncbi:hypothetical protein KP509_28G024000 [Ceratopteris richardii]|uniref:Uncharacterized protein n=1 Tax=Ceratopteris richardii TaxID=49495 RepID=A0A8T2RAG0_CERRI|nr:hypothetical protein KP509_28G024000 [Ceratopteris richardii]